MAIDQPELATVRVKKYGNGKTRAWLTADARHVDALAEALLRSLRVWVDVDHALLRQLALEAGMSEPVIDAVISTIEVDDQLYLSTDWPR